MPLPMINRASACSIAMASTDPFVSIWQPKNSAFARISEPKSAVPMELSILSCASRRPDIRIFAASRRSSRCEPPRSKAPATREEIAEYSAGLICLAGAEGGPSLESAFLIFGKDCVFAELQRHMQREQEARNQHIIDTAGRLKIPLLATNGAWHARPEQRVVADVLACVREKVQLADAGRLLTRNAERHLKTYRRWRGALRTFRTRLRTQSNYRIG